HPALLGGTGRGRDRQGDELFGGQRQNALLPGCARVGSSAHRARHYARPEIMNETQERQFGYRIRQILNQGTHELKPGVAQRLATARQRALERHSVEPALAWADNVTGDGVGWAGLA